ncbi:hypothetical protein [Acinetobacter sp. CS-2]|uniref:hypothetical protein n=1 Tax=Acinetobacter sp. CS-2 TaxID=2798861 RepID=UPI001908ED04|nr:hypothetical protein [Acinetobacter sp. CS-2]QQN40211.1 hypothetical protein JFY49_04565 [Acinetobacter sp. CS-2]
MFNKSVFDGVVVCEAANVMATHIIKEFEIPRLDHLAPKLRVNTCFNDHQAVRLWADRLCDNYPISHDFNIYDLEDLIQTARTKFLKVIS